MFIQEEKPVFGLFYFWKKPAIPTQFTYFLKTKSYLYFPYDAFLKDQKPISIYAILLAFFKKAK